MGCGKVRGGFIFILPQREIGHGGQHGHLRKTGKGCRQCGVTVRTAEFLVTCRRGQSPFSLGSRVYPSAFFFFF